jgi:hypothetical protein
MNERIKELMVQVCKEQGLPFTVEHNSAYMLDAFSEKFAKLIVKECAALTKSKSEHIQSMLTDDRGDQAQIHSLAWQFEEFGYEIKKHFGVKE